MTPSPADLRAQHDRSASRRRVLDVLRASADGCHVQDLAEHTGLHANTVRFHLESLESDGLVSRQVQRSGERGRPPLTYVAMPVPDAEAARRDFARLAEVLAQLVTRAVDDPAALAIEAGRSWGASRTEAPPSPMDGEAGIADLTATLDELGFSPEITDGQDEAQRVMLQRHCPFLEVAREHEEVVCSVHLGLMRGVLQKLEAPVSAERLLPFATTAGCEAHLRLVTRSTA